jgi:5,10-methylenetetrahydromethanopterin reductase
MNANPAQRVEFGHVSWCPPFQGATIAQENEAFGFDVQYFGDNQCLTSDTFSELRAAAAATTDMRIATGVTNLVTRHPAVVASSIAGVQVVSQGRAICGVGKGDSALGMIGLRPQHHDEFVERMAMLRTYLSGESQRTGSWDSRLQWLDDVDYAPVPLEMMASGPKSLEAAGQLCDRVSLAVGAAPERIAWALDIVYEAAERAGRSRDDVTVGAFVNIVIDDDQTQAADLLRTRVKGWAHMASFPGHDLQTQPEIMRSATRRLRNEYDYAHHDSEVGSPLADLVSAEFAGWFGIGGPRSYVIDRLVELGQLGLRHFNFAALPTGEREMMASAIMPQVRDALGDRTSAAGR